MTTHSFNIRFPHSCIGQPTVFDAGYLERGHFTILVPVGALVQWRRETGNRKANKETDKCTWTGNYGEFHTSQATMAVTLGMLQACSKQ